jgi:hypothetical protein
MGFNVQIPAVGLPHSSEDVKVGNSLSTIQTWGNGNILGSDLSPNAAIARPQMAGGFGNLAAAVVGVNTSVVDGKFYIVTAGSTTMTLPTPTVNATVGVTANSGQAGAAPTTIARSSGVINGLGVAAATSIVLGSVGAYVVLLADGTNWNIVAGQQDTGWLPLALGPGIIAFSPYTPSARLQGDTVRLKGVLQNNSGLIAANATWATIPSACHPGTGLLFPIPAYQNASNWSSAPWGINTAGIIYNPINGLSAGYGVYLDGVTYTLS